MSATDFRLTLAILAAGRSARFGHPKTLEPVGPSGEVLFEYAICDAIRAGCGRVVFVTSADRTEQIMSRAAEHAGRAVPVDFVAQSLDDLPAGAVPPAQRAKPWGTGHAVFALRKKIEEPFLVVNADDFYGPRAIESFGRRVADALAGGDDVHFLAAYELHRTGVSSASGVNRGIVAAGASAPGNPGGASRATCEPSTRPSSGPWRHAGVPPESAPGNAGVPPASGPGNAGVPPASGPGNAGVPPASGFLERLHEVYDVRRTDSGLVGRDGSGEVRKLAPEAPCSMNLWAFQPFIFEHLEAAFAAFHAGLADPPADPLTSEFLLSETVGDLVGQGGARVRLLPMSQSTAGLTYPGDLPPVAATLSDAVAAGDYPADLSEWFAGRSSRRLT